MAWNEPGNNNPWGGRPNGNGSGDQGPPDLDELARKLQEKINGVFGGKKAGGGSSGAGSAANGGMIGLLLLALAAAATYSATHIIQPAEQGVVLRFGRYIESMQPGLHFTMPYPIDEVLRVDVSEVRSLRYKGTMLSADEAIVDLGLSVQFVIKDARQYLFEVLDPEATIGQATASAIREVVGKRQLDDVIQSARSEVAAETQLLLQTILDDYETGLQVTSVNLNDAQAPSEVQSAFQDAIKAREDLERMKNEAQAYANDIIPRARGYAARVLQQATGYRDARIAQAQGEVARFTQLLTEYKRAPAITRERMYLESMEAVMANSSKVMIDVDGDSNPLLYVPLDKLMEGAGASRPAATAAGQSASTSAGDAGTSEASRRSRDRSRGSR